MGGWISRTRKESRILIQGLDAAGKTSLLYRLKLGEVVTTIPTIGFNVETVSIGNVSLTCWDLGGRDKIRPLYRHYYQNTHGIIFLIDSNDRDRIDYALDEFMRYTLLEDDLRATVVMVLANKQDLDGAMTPFEIEDAVLKKLNGNKRLPNQELFVFPCSVVNNTGIDKAMAYFVNRLKKRSSDQEKIHGLKTITERAAEDAKAANPSTSKLQPQENDFSVKSFVKDPVGFFKSLMMS